NCPYEFRHLPSLVRDVVGSGCRASEPVHESTRHGGLVNRESWSRPREASVGAEAVAVRQPVTMSRGDRRPLALALGIASVLLPLTLSCHPHGMGPSPRDLIGVWDAQPATLRSRA